MSETPWSTSYVWPHCKMVLPAGTASVPILPSPPIPSPPLPPPRSVLNQLVPSTRKASDCNTKRTYRGSNAARISVDLHPGMSAVFLTINRISKYIILSRCPPQIKTNPSLQMSSSCTGHVLASSEARKKLKLSKPASAAEREPNICHSWLAFSTIYTDRRSKKKYAHTTGRFSALCNRGDRQQWKKCAPANQENNCCCNFLLPGAIWCCCYLDHQQPRDCMATSC